MKQGPSPRAWPAIKKRYQNAESIASIARRFNTTRETIKRHAKAESWAVDAKQAVEQMVQDSTASPREIGRAVRAQVIEASTQAALKNPDIALVVEDMTTTLRRQSAFASRLTSIAGQFLDDIEDGTITHAPHLTRGSLLLEAVALCNAAQGFVRLAAGLKAGIANVVERDNMKVRRFTVVPHRSRTGESQGEDADVS